MAYGWYKSGWEKAPLKFSTGVMYKSNLDKDGKVYEVQGLPNQVPFPLSNANMAFDGKISSCSAEVAIKLVLWIKSSAL